MMGQPFHVTPATMKRLGIPHSDYVTLSDDVMEKFVFATGANRFYHSSMESTVATIQKQAPGHTILVYDLGLTEQEVADVSNDY